MVTCFVVIAVLALLVVVLVGHVRRDRHEFPFITDMQRGVCPRCGATRRDPTNPERGFWNHFHCTFCGLSVKAHLKDG